MNRTFEAQLHQFGALDGPPEDWAGFVAAIGAAYDRTETDRQALDEELRVARMLGALGQLATGIAHEINTPVQYIGDSIVFLRGAFEDLHEMVGCWAAAREELGAMDGAAGLVERLTEAEEQADLSYLVAQVPSAFERVSDGIERVGAIVRAMKEFAHPDQREMAAADLNRGVRNTLIVAHSEFKYCAKVETVLSDLPAVACHAGEINQALLNLIVNAAHAISDAQRGDEGLIRITTRVEEPWVVIAVGDNGVGIPRETQARVFDPFFTTKGVGRGTGQGLPIAREIVVDKHQGTLTFQTEPGRGTTFEIRLPMGSPPTRSRCGEV